MVSKAPTLLRGDQRFESASLADIEIGAACLWREEPHGMRVTRFDHCNLHGPNIDQVVDFFTEVLDFSPTEAAETPDGIAAAFLSCSNKAHDVALIRRDEPAKFHHVAFSLDSWHEVGQAADIIARYDIPLDIGPTRHPSERGKAGLRY